MKFKVSPMRCASCAKSITRMILAADPGASVRVDLGAGTVDVDGSALSPADVVALLDGGGYVGELIAGDSDSEVAEGACCGGRCQG